MILRPRHLECIRLMLDTSMNQTQIAEILELNSETIYRWNKDEEFKAELLKQTQGKFSAMATKATLELEKLLLTAKNETVRLNACKDVLDRAGFKPTDKSEIKHEGISINIDYGQDK